MVQKSGNALVLEVRKTQQRGVIRKSCGELRFRHGLLAPAAYPRNPDYVAITTFFGRKSQHGPQKSNLTNSELCGVNPDGDSACTSGQIVAGKGPLPPFVQLALGIQSKRVRGNDQARTQLFPQSHQKFPSRVWKCVGLF